MKPIHKTAMLFFAVAFLAVLAGLFTFKKINEALAPKLPAIPPAPPEAPTALAPIENEYTEPEPETLVQQEAETSANIIEADIEAEKTDPYAPKLFSKIDKNGTERWYIRERNGSVKLAKKPEQ